MAPPPSITIAHRQSLPASREVGSWFKDHASLATARMQLDLLELLCRRIGKEPRELIASARRSPRRLQDVVQENLRRQLTPS